MVVVFPDHTHLLLERRNTDSSVRHIGLTKFLMTYGLYKIDPYLVINFNPFMRHGISPPLSIGTVHFCFKGRLVVIFILILIEFSASLIKTPRFVASGLGLHCLHMSHNRTLGFMG